MVEVGSVLRAQADYVEVLRGDAKRKRVETETAIAAARVRKSQLTDNGAIPESELDDEPTNEMNVLYNHIGRMSVGEVPVALEGEDFS